jgi:hypothetical protein
MEGSSTLSNLLVKNDYAISFDLKEAYNHVPVHVTMQPLLGLAWKGNCYKCLEMPFGLNDAPRVYMMIMRMCVRIIREVLDVKTEIYLDDLLLLHQDPDRLRMIGQEVSLFLQWLGLTVKLTLIGVLNAARIQFPRSSLFMMKLNKLKTRVVKRHGWNGLARMNPSVLCKLQTWIQWIKSNCPNLLKKMPLPQAVITTDAAPTGWGAALSSMSSRILSKVAEHGLRKCRTLPATNGNLWLSTKFWRPLPQ